MVLKMMLVLAPACRVSISALYLVSTLCRYLDMQMCRYLDIQEHNIRVVLAGSGRAQIMERLERCQARGSQGGMRSGDGVFRFKL